MPQDEGEMLTKLSKSCTQEDLNILVDPDERVPITLLIIKKFQKVNDKVNF
ncbi:MAG: hypothetical protein ACFFD2_28980 [Promethearchaeota archaeon]